MLITLVKEHKVQCSIRLLGNHVWDSYNIGSVDQYSFNVSHWSWPVFKIKAKNRFTSLRMTLELLGCLHLLHCNADDSTAGFINEYQQKKICEE
jgi:hypothetical protein